MAPSERLDEDQMSRNELDQVKRFSPKSRLSMPNLMAEILCDLMQDEGANPCT